MSTEGKPAGERRGKPTGEHQHEQPTDAAPEDIAARLSRLEALVEHLLAREGTDAPGASAAPAPPPDTVPAVDPGSRTPAPPDADVFWALHALQERLPSPGGVVLAGSVDLPQGPVHYQWGRPTEHVLRTDWAEHADAAAALGHPLRLAILRLLLDGERTVAQLVDELALSSTGIAYHHLNQLQGAGWITSPQRGAWTLRASRIVPLMTIVIALEDG